MTIERSLWTSSCLRSRSCGDGTTVDRSGQVGPGWGPFGWSESNVKRGALLSWRPARRLRTQAVRRLVAFYVEYHNTVMPHRAVDARTRDEVHFGGAANFACELAERRRVAREQRLASNQSMTCVTRGPRDTAAVAVPREAASIPLDAIASVMTWEALIQSRA